MALQCKRLKYLEKRMYFLLTSQDKCLEFMTLEYESFKVKVTNNKYCESQKTWEFSDELDIVFVMN